MYEYFTYDEWRRILNELSNWHGPYTLVVLSNAAEDTGNGIRYRPGKLEVVIPTAYHLGILSDQ